MINLVDISDFKGTYKIPLYTGNDEAFNEIIAETQYDVLIDLMGFPIYNEFDIALQNPPVDVKWTDLHDGVIYENFNNFDTNWQGLKYLLIPFIWVAWVEFSRDHLSPVSMVEVNPRNANRSNDLNYYKLLHKRQNEGVKRYYEAYNFMYSNINDYNDFTTFFKKKIRNSIITKSSII